MRKTLFSGILVLVIALGAATFTARTIFAATDLGYCWAGSSAIVENRTSSYSVAVSDAANSYHNYTDLTVSQSTSGSNIIYLQGNYGAGMSNAVAIANSYYGGSWHACANADGSLTGACNTSDKKASHAYIYFNDYHGTFPLPQWGTRHEMGHVFGLGHVSCATDSVMKDGSCYPNVPTTLRTDEINQINAWY
jgi:hypothetical protein